MAGQVTPFQLKGTVGTFIALDPSRNRFSEGSRRSDATYVLVIHTDVIRYGTRYNIGHGMSAILDAF